MEIYVLVPQEKSAIIKIIEWFVLALAALCCLALVVAPPFIPVAFLLIVLWVLIHNGFNKEYEYSYFDGEVRFARIMNKSRRKKLQSYSMESVVQIAPAGDRSVYKYENDNSVKVKDYSSKRKQIPYYDLIVKESDGVFLYKVELDDKFLDAVCIKYSSKVIRRKDA